MAHRSQRSSLEDNPLDPNYLPPHYREDYRLAIDALVEHDVEGYYNFLQSTGVVDFLSQPEVEYIKNVLRAPPDTPQPELPYYESDADGSSDTYWPVHSDLEAPVLDLGWPVHQGFVGPTEVTILINPSDPEMPSIKEQARRLIKNARQVIAVAMDMFTDVDIFAELLDAAARRVAVYIVLEEQNAHNFIAMVNSCRVSLEKIQLMRVRTVSGSTYYCRSGKSFKGQMMDRFLLVDCRAVLCGNYSFMWTFEKIHRCIAQLLLGELVFPFDEEFRILYAQSQPLVMENVMVPVPGESQYGIRQFGGGKPASSRNPREYMHMESSHFPELPGYPVEDRMQMESYMPPFQRHDLFHGHSEPDMLQLYNSKYGSQQQRMDRSFAEQNRPPMISRHTDMNAYKRHSYAEEKHEIHPSSQQMKHRMYYPEEVQSLGGHHREQHHYYKGEGPGSGHAIYDKIQDRGYHQAVQYEYQPELEPPGSYNPPLGYLSSNSSRDTKHSYGQKLAPVEGRYGRSSTKRPSLGQSFLCQTSPTQLHAPDQKQLFTKSSLDRQPQDPTMKQGLRKWRISSYLSTMENASDEGLPEPLGPDAFEEPAHQFEEDLYAAEASLSRFSGGDCLQVPRTKPNLQPQHEKPAVPKMSKVTPENQPSLETDCQILAEAPAEMTTTVTSESLLTADGDKNVEVDLRKPRDIRKQESFRSRPNLSLLRSSRLRSSLIFSSSQLEQHFSAEMEPTKENPIEEKEGDPLKTSSVMAELLEKRKTVSRQPIDWSTLKQQPVQNTAPVTLPEPSASVNIKKPDHSEASTEGHPKSQEPSASTRVSENKEMPKNPAQEQRIEQLNVASQEEAKPKMTGEPYKSLCRTPAFVDMNDPESRFQYFKELAAKRKALQTATESDIKNPEFSTKITKADSSSALPESSLVMQMKSDTTRISGNQETERHSTQVQLQEPSKVAEENMVKPASLVEPPKASLSSTSFLNMNDPETRLLFFKDLAAKRKASKNASQPEPVVTTSDTFKTTLPEGSSKIQEKSERAHISGNPDKAKNVAEVQLQEQSKVIPEETSKTVLVEPTNPALHTTSLINMNDPEIRSRCFKELAANQKASELTGHFANRNTSSILTERSSRTQENSDSIIISGNDDMQKDITEIEQCKVATENSCSLNVNDPETRFMHSEELPDKQKASEVVNHPDDNNSERATTHPDTSSSLPESSPKTQGTSDSTGISGNIETQKGTKEMAQTGQSKVAAEGTSKGFENSSKITTLSTNSSNLNLNDPETRFMYFKELAEKQKASKTATECEPNIPDNVKDTDLSKAPPEKCHNRPAESSNAESTTIFEVSQDPTIRSSEKPAISAELTSKMPAPSEETMGIRQEIKEDLSEHDNLEHDLSVKQQDHNCMTDGVEEATMSKEPGRESTLNENTSKPSLPTPVCLITSSENLSKGVTDAEKSEMKSCSQGISGTVLGESDKPSHQSPDTSSSSNIETHTGNGKPNAEVHEHLDKEAQGLSHTNCAEKPAGENLTAQNTVSTPAVLEQLDSKGSLISSTPGNTDVTGAAESKGEDVNQNPLTSAGTKSSLSRYQASTANVLNSSNLKDDTKVILEQISANSQGRMELVKQTAALTDDAKGGDHEQSANKGLEKVKSGWSAGHIHRSGSNPEEREVLLKRIESMRKEKKVYSRFEVGS